ncbi:hypothetical protein M9434_005771 [Picochlorum sp. BPE23]|nr:hypothetical protein M9434_005771 [Picochlorum sp. BPE23]
MDCVPNPKRRRIDTKGHHGWMPIHYACHRGDVTLLRHILLSSDQKNGTIFSITTRSQSTPLHIAAISGHVECVDVILAFLAEHIPDAVARRRVLTQHSSPISPHMQWTVPKEEDFTESFGPNDMLMSSKRTGFQPLDLAVLSNAPEIVSRLLTAIHETCPPQEKHSPHAIKGMILSDLLPAAIVRGNATILEALIDHGASIEAVCVEEEDVGMRPIHWAVACGDAMILSLLLQRGADPSAKTQHTNESIQGVAERCCCHATEDLVRLVLETQHAPEL